MTNTDGSDKDTLLKRFSENAILGTAVALVVYLLLGILVWGVLNLCIDPTAIKDDGNASTAKKDLFQALGFILARLAGAIGVYSETNNGSILASIVAR